MPCKVFGDIAVGDKFCISRHKNITYMKMEVIEDHWGNRYTAVSLDGWPAEFTDGEKIQDPEE